MNNENSNEDYVDDVILTEEKKERVLKELHEEIEMQKAKYLLNGVHRDTEENNNVESNDDHYATLSKAKENLNQIQNDLNSYSLQNETSNDNYTYQIHHMANEDNNNNALYEEEAPKDFENEISQSMNGNQEEILTSERNEINYPLQPSYNFFNPIDNTNATTHKGKSSVEFMNKIKKKYVPKYKNTSSFRPPSNYEQRRTKSKAKKRDENMKKEIEEKFKQEHPFKPTITSSVHLGRFESESERIARLSRPKTIEINQRMRQKEIEEQREISSNKHTINRNVNPKQVSEKLFQMHQQLKEKKEKLKREYEDQIISEYSFAPQINPQSKILMNKYDNGIDIYTRGEQYEKAKEENLKMKREALEQEAKSKNKPMISEKSKKLAMKRHNTDNIDVYNRLYNNENNKDIDRSNYNDRDLEECTFTPNIISHSMITGDDTEGNQMNPSTIPNSGNINDFLSRQKIYEDIKRERQNRISQKAPKEECTFKPKINLTSDILVRTNTSRIAENKYNRLYEDYKKIQNRKEQLESFYNAQFDFKPKINELSRFIGREPTVNNLYTTDSKNVSTMSKKTNMTVDDECTFQPKLNTNSKYDHVQSNYKNDEAILNRINEEVKSKNEKISGLQNVLVKMDTKECSFQPEINRNVPNFESNKPMVMKGMAKYLEQMEKARKAKRDKEEREKEVFITGENWSRDNLITVPKPFKLSYQNIRKKDDIKKQREMQEMKECTFKPKTNESKNREIIKQLLKDA